jgi:TfoX/Sxy family transcriptional regulator of competence genes
MAYNVELAQRVRQLLKRRRGITEKKMFGGLAYLFHGNMTCGVIGSRLMVRVGPEQYEKALARPHAGPMDFTGRPMKGFVYVAAQGLQTDSELRPWIDLSLRFARSLPPK